MSIEYGKHNAEICGHGLAMINDKLAVRISFDFGGESMDAMLFVTENSGHIAKAQLFRCGFDSDKTTLDTLAEQPMLLAGRRVDVNVKDYQGRQQVNILVDNPPTPELIARAQAILRGTTEPKAAVAAGVADDDDMP